MIPILVNIDGFNISGLQVRTSNRNEFNPATAKLPDLWQRFFAEAPDLPMFGVYSDYESNTEGLYTVTAGGKVDHSSNNTLKVLSGDYLVFEGQGSMPHAVVETWQRVWHYFEGKNKFQRCFKTDFEMYKGNEEIAIYIGVQLTPSA